VQFPMFEAKEFVVRVMHMLWPVL